jgi:2-oxoglutarate ferredoxin oxidoreductase subunit gamma
MDVFPADGGQVQLELYMSGIGGQGIQLMAKILALAALHEDRHVLFASDYGHTMRGGSSIATVIVGARPLNALPVIAGADAALLMHHQYLEKPVSRLRPGALVVADSHLMELLPPMPQQKVVAAPASEIAREVGNPMTTGLALLSSFAAITGLVKTESLIEAMKSTVPSYRTQHIEKNAAALRLGAERATASHPIDLDAMAREGALA